MARPAGALGATFMLTSPADLYRKINYEAIELRNSPPANIEGVAYAVMNSITSAWQMKDWVYRTLKTEGRLDDLNSFADRQIKSAEDFGTFLTTSRPMMDMCFQIATAAKHLGLRKEPENVAISFVAEDWPDRLRAHDMDVGPVLMVATPEIITSAADLVLSIAYLWKRALVDLRLMEDDDPPPTHVFEVPEIRFEDDERRADLV